MAKKLVAAVDGVLLKVGNEIRSLYADAEIPAGADERHVQHLTNLGLLVEPPPADGDDDAADDPDGDGPMPAKSASRADWDAFAKSDAGGSLSDDDLAAFSSKEALQAHYGVA